MKRTLLAFSLLLGLLWLLPGCKKDDGPGPAVIQGRLTEYGTAAPVKDAKIYLSCDESQFGGPPVSKLFDSLSTDADGRFYKEYPAGEFCANVVIQPYKKGYFVPTPLDYVTVPKQYDFVMDPEAWLRIRCIPDMGSSSMHFQVDNYSKSVNSSVGDITYYYLGGVPLYGGRTPKIYWTVYPSANKFQGDIFLAPHDTTVYTIHY